MSNYGLQRINLVRLCERVGVRTWDQGKTRRVQRPINVVRAALAERLLGPDLGEIGGGKSLVEIDTWLGRMVSTERGEHGWLLQAAQGSIRDGYHAMAEARRLYALPSRPYKRVMAALADARKHFDKAQQYQDQHEQSRKDQHGTEYHA